MKIDCTGLACPQPVLMTKKALEELTSGSATVIVDNAAARENVERFAGSQGAAVSVAQVGEARWELTITKGAAGCEVYPSPALGVDQPRALLILSDRMGSDPALGGVLMRALLATLPKASNPPKKLIFMNAGVKLASEGSAVVEELTTLANLGAEVLSCGTCLDYFGLKDKLAVGRVTNMYDTVETLTHGYVVTTIT